jgi:hypothetical protein
MVSFLPELFLVTKLPPTRVDEPDTGRLDA